ncbi:MAG: hypothetical protein AAGA47_01295 [Pseudomonadota bacterium]
MRAIAFFLSLAASQAAALSCLPTDVATSYRQADAAEEVFVIALGRFSFDAMALEPLSPANNNPPTREVTARFTGGLFTGRNFSFETEVDVTIEALCYGPWCASMVPDVESLAFIERQGDTYRLAIDPCGGRLFSEPTQAQLDQIAACHKGGSCPSVFD